MATQQCSGKRCYRDFVTARKMAKRTNNDRDGAHVGPYRCRICCAWHVGADESAKSFGRRPRVEV